MTRLENTESVTEKAYSLFTEIMKDVDVLMGQRVFNYFPVSADEFNSALNSEKNPLYLFKIVNKDLTFAETFSQRKRKKEVPKICIQCISKS